MPPKKLFSKKGGAIGVSFLPPEKPTESGVTTYQKGVAAIAFSLVVAVFGTVWVYYLVQARSYGAQATAIAARAEGILGELNQKKTEMEAVQKVARVVVPAKALLAKHPQWTKFFSLMEESTLPDVKFGTFSGDEKGVTMTGNAKDYETISRQMIAFQLSPLIHDLRVSGLAARVGPQGQVTGVDFTLAFVIDESLLKP